MLVSTCPYVIISCRRSLVNRTQRLVTWCKQAVYVQLLLSTEQVVFVLLQIINDAA